MLLINTLEVLVEYSLQEKIQTDSIREHLSGSLSVFTDLQLLQLGLNTLWPLDIIQGMGHGEEGRRVFFFCGWLSKVPHDYIAALANSKGNSLKLNKVVHMSWMVHHFLCGVAQISS